jgi:hypothetical protein
MKEEPRELGATHSFVIPGLTGMSSSWTFLAGALICVILRRDADER